MQYISDKLQTIFIAVFGVTLIEFINHLVTGNWIQFVIGILTIIYLVYKIRNERKKGKNFQVNKTDISNNKTDKNGKIKRLENY